MKSRQRKNHSRQSKKTSTPRRRSHWGRALRFEPMESRHLLAGFLQGFAFVDGNGNDQLDPGEQRKDNATIQLRSADGSLLLQTDTTDADGYYRFDNVLSGTYRIREIAPGYVTSGVQIDSMLSTAIQVGNDIQVTYTAPDDPAWLAPPLQIDHQANLPGVDSAFTLVGGVFNSNTSVANSTNAHQFQLLLQGGVLPGPTAPFYSFCVDVFHANPATFDVIPSLFPQAPGLPTNIGRIGYLYNEIGRNLLSPQNGTGLQLALYELVYDVSPDFTSGNFVVNSGTTNAAAYAAAQNYLSLSAGKDQAAYFLNVTPPVPVHDLGRQGQLVTENFNFANEPAQGDLFITITPDDVNEVGQSHTFTITVMQDDGLTAAQGGDGVTGFAPANNASVDVTLDGINGAIPDLSAPTDEAPSDPTLVMGTTNALGQFTVTFSSATAGQVIGTATTTHVVAGTPITRSTDGTGNNSGAAKKRFVDANISITPDDTNEVGDPHTFTVTVMQDDGLTAAQGGDGVTGFTAATVGNVDVTLTDSNGAASVLDAGASTSDDNQPNGDNLDASGQTTTVFTSETAGQVTGHATVTLVVGGVTLVRETDGIADNSGDAVKTFVDAKISITPDDTNEVGDPHTFTVTVMQDDGLTAAQGGDGVTGFTAATVGNVDVTLTDSNGAVSVLDAGASTSDDNQPNGDNLDASGQTTTVFTSATAGQVTGHATVTLVVGGVTLVRETDGIADNSGDAVKTFVDAKISITPDDTNEVGDPHTFTVTVMQDDGLTAAQGGDGVTGFTAATVGNVDVTLTDSNGAASVLDAGASTSDDNQPNGDNLDASGQTTTVFTSATAGQVTGHATVTLVVGGVTLVRETDGIADNSGDAVKTFVDAKISITPDDTNEVGDPHTFTVTVMQDDGLTAAQGGDGVTGFTAATVGNVDVTLTDSNGAVSVLDAGASTSDDNQPNGDNLDASGQTTTVFTSATAGQVTGHATVTLVVGGVTLVRETDGIADNSGDAVKTFVDARITIGPDGTNEVGQNHTFTVTVQQDDGLTAAQGGDGVTGFAATVGANVDVTLTNVGGAVATPAGPFNGITNASGQFQVTFTSAAAGQVIGNASTTFVLAGVSLTRDTDPATASVGAGPGGSGPAVKTFVRPGIKMKKFTNGHDADTVEEAPEIAPGQTVTWTYVVENTGQVPFTRAEIVIVDDAGTPGDNSDDFSTTSGDITLIEATDVGDDDILSPGEIWTYEASAVAEDLSSSVGPPVTFDFSGSSALDGPDGNIRSYTSGSLSVNVSAFSRDVASGGWSTAFLGAYSGGLGVTDNSEGSGGNNSHTVDNLGGRDNYVLFEFSEVVVVDSAFLGFVVDDSDLRYWIGTVTDVFNNHQTLSDAFLTSLGFTEMNETTLTTTRLADLNAGGVSGNVLVIAANTGEPTTEDNFKIEKVKTQEVEEICYENFAVVTTGPGRPTDSDISHYCNPHGEPDIKLKKFTNGVDADSMEEAPEIAPGATVTWTYHVTNTGEVDFTSTQIDIVDDAGTPGDESDDFSTDDGGITFQSVLVGDGDNLLEPGETWVYEASGIAEDLSTTVGPATTFDFSGSSATDGTNGNIRTFTSGSTSVKASAFSRDSSGVWQTAFLGAYDGGLGITDNSEGDGSNNMHTVDNLVRDNYVLFEFNQIVVVDEAFLGYVVDDSDLRIWIGTVSDVFNNHQTLSDDFLSDLGFTEINETTLTTTRWADLNAGNISGNVLVIAANTEEPTTEDNFKIEKVKTKEVEEVCYQNRAVVTTGQGGPTDSDMSFYCNPHGEPGIEIKKFTNGHDADTAAEAAEITAGDLVTWTYEVKNTGTLPFASTDILVTDDAGTPGNTSDDFSTTSGAITFQSVLVGDGDNMLEPGETWVYEATGIADDLMTTGSSSTFDFEGNTSTDGTDGIIRTFTAGGVSVKTSAFSRDKSTGAWTAAYLGSYSGGLGVTDNSEGNGSNNTHTVDNSGRDNYVLFEFSQTVVVDSAFLGFVSGDSDLTLWIGSTVDPFNNHIALNNSVLSSMGFTEVNMGGSGTRTADFNSGNIAGNVLVIAAKTGESNDFFKIEKLDIKKLEMGLYKNIGKVVVDGASDDDASHYKNPECVEVQFAFAGNTAVTGTAGNIRTYSVNGVSVKVSAFSRTTGTSGTWNTAYLGEYADGLGVTDGSENGSGGTHRVDNVGRYNFVLFEFSTLVEVDRAFLDSVVTDSDITVFVGMANNPFHNHITLSDASASMAVLAENNDADNDNARWADFNNGGVIGNVLVIAASMTDTTPDDQFKISKLDVCAKAVKFYTVDAGSDDTFEYGPSGQSLANYNLAATNANPRGVATTAANTKVWVIDGNKKVFVYDTNGVLQGTGWTANGLATPEDITTNGTDIWIVDDGSNKVFRYSNAASRTTGSQSAASSFTLNSGNANAKGIVTDGNFLWVVNDTATTDKVFKYNLSGVLQGSWTIDAANGSPTGIALDPSGPDHLWISDSADDAVYRYNSAVGRTSGNQNASHVFQLAGGNGDVQGIADPPPGGSSDAWPFGSSSDVGAFSMPLDSRSGFNDRVLCDWSGKSSAARSPLAELGSRERLLRADRWLDSLTALAPVIAESPYVQEWASSEVRGAANESGDVDATDAFFAEFAVESLDDAALEAVAAKLLAR